MSNQNILLLHDVDLKSGFQGSNAKKYKIKKEKLLKILSFLNRKSIKLSFDDGGSSINYRFLKPLCELYEIYVFVPTKYIDNPNFLTTSEIIELSKSKVIIGSHSHSHLNFLDKDVSLDFRSDWLLSKKKLEKLINKKVTSCSIPYGIYNDSHISILKDMGFEKIMTSDPPTRINKTNIQPRIALDNRFYYFEFLFLKLFKIKYLIFRVKLFKYFKSKL